MKISTLGYTPSEADDYPCWGQEMVLDGVACGWYLNPFQMQASLERADGKALHRIITCSCGEFGCEGFSVKTDTENDLLVWRSFQGHNDPSKDLFEMPSMDDEKSSNKRVIQTPLYFEIQAYKDLAEKMCEEYEQHIQRERKKNTARHEQDFPLSQRENLKRLIAQAKTKDELFNAFKTQEKILFSSKDVRGFDWGMVLPTDFVIENIEKNFQNKNLKGIWDGYDLREKMKELLASQV